MEERERGVFLVRRLDRLERLLLGEARTSPEAVEAASLGVPYPLRGSIAAAAARGGGGGGGGGGDGDAETDEGGAATADREKGGAGTGQAEEKRHLVDKIRQLRQGIVKMEESCKDLKEIQRLVTSLAPQLRSAGYPLGSAESLEAKERLICAGRGGVEDSARHLSAVHKLKSHINQPYLQDIPAFTARLDAMAAKHSTQASTAALLFSKTEALLSHCGQAMDLASEKFVLWDEAVGQWEEEQAEKSKKGATNG